MTLSNSGVRLADPCLSLGRKHDTERQDRGILGMSREGQSGLQKADRAGVSGDGAGKTKLQGWRTASNWEPWYDRSPTR